MKENYGQVASLLDTSCLQGLYFIRHMEQLCSDPGIMANTV